MLDTVMSLEREVDVLIVDDGSPDDCRKGPPKNDRIQRTHSLEERTENWD